MYENFKLIRRYQSQRRTGFRATIIFCRWGPISERRNGGETLGQVRHFHREFMNALCLPRSQRGTSLSSCSLSSTEKKRKIIILEKVLQTTFSLIVSPPSLFLSPYLRSSFAHARQKGARFRNEESFSLSRKKILRTAPRNGQVSPKYRKAPRDI